MRSKSLAFILVSLLVSSSFIVVAVSDTSDASITVRDGDGNFFTFDGPVDRIITIGVGTTATAIGVSALDKILVCDRYSKTNEDPLFDDLRRYVDEGKIAANGTIYDSGKEQLKMDIITAAEPTKEVHFDREKDVVLAVASPSYRANLSFLKEEGFKNVMYWSDVSTYGDIIDFVETISMVCNGRIDANAAMMRAVVEKIDVTLSQEQPERVEAFYVTHSSGVFKVGNTKSITTAMIEAAGGIVITKDDSKSESTIEVNLTDLVSKHPNAMIFADSQVFNSEDLMKSLRAQVGNDITIKGLKGIWNNFSIESSKGVWAMAGSMYPDYFDGDMPSGDTSDGDIMMYAVSSIIASAVLLCVAYYYMRPQKR